MVRTGLKWLWLVKLISEGGEETESDKILCGKALIFAFLLKKSAK